MTPMPPSTPFERIAALLARTPREPDLVVFVGRGTGLFIDNVKYAFLHAFRHARGLRVMFMTFGRSECKDLQAQGLPAFCFEDPDGPATLALAGIIVSDDFWWRSKSPAGALTSGAFMVQLWHGIPLKAIGFPEIESPVNMTPEKARDLTVGYSGYDAVLSTSPFFTEKAFARAFRAKSFWELGYPRNDALLREPDKLDMINVDAPLYSDLKRFKKEGGKVIFYMPTFRDAGGNAVKDRNVDMLALKQFAERNNAVVVCKFHPYEDVEFESDVRNLRFCSPKADPYPLLRLADVLVTDYSSIYFDFLLTGRPIVFFPYDFEVYITLNRELLFDYDQFTPGPKVRDTPGLIKALSDLLAGEDPYAPWREELARLSFTHRDAHAGQRLLDALERLARGENPEEHATVGD